MLRRQALAVLAGSTALLYSRSIAGLRPKKLDRFVEAKQGCALLLDAQTGEVIASNSNSQLGTILVPPGSTLKPVVLSALLVSGRLRPNEAFVCPEKLSLAGHRMDCSHPRLGAPVTIETALAYSCNCFVAHFAERFAPGQLAGNLPMSGNVTPQPSADMQKLQALGTAGVLVTPLGMAQTYRKLALHARPEILAGLESAVDYGTAQAAHVSWARLAGKTGSAHTEENFIAWFAGYTRKVVVTVMLAGRHGGSDAAPVAAQILDAWHTGQL